VFIALLFPVEMPREEVELPNDSSAACTDAMHIASPLNHHDCNDAVINKAEVETEAPENVTDDHYESHHDNLLELQLNDTDPYSLGETEIGEEEMDEGMSQADEDDLILNSGYTGSESKLEALTDGVLDGDSDRNNKPASASVPNADEIIILVESDDEEEEDTRKQDSKRQKVESNGSASGAHLLKRPPGEGAIQSHHHRRPSNLPPWMQQAANTMRSGSIVPGQTLPNHLQHQQMVEQLAYTDSMARAPALTNYAAAPTLHPLGAPPAVFRPQPQQPMLDVAHYFDLPPDFTPSWEHVLPPPSVVRSVDNALQPKAFLLSLLNVNEFSLTGLPVSSMDVRPTPISGMRVPIRKISRTHGKAEYEPGTGSGNGDKWRIPLGAYQPIYAYLTSIPNCRVDGIPHRQLQIASLERARQEKGFPSSEDLVEKGVPPGLAAALAPFQRGGVDFVLEKQGRALIADGKWGPLYANTRLSILCLMLVVFIRTDMGLGKTIQGIAAISAYRDEWPVLVLTPSSARYHWATEFNNWLGVDSDVNRANSDSANYRLIKESQVNVLSSSKDKLLPHSDTAVVICSYGLAPLLVANKKIRPGRFRCAIVDESHMLKNKGSKRVQMLAPILAAMDRCILLSGTPALAQPIELWPQLQILRAGRFNWWDDEADFIGKYVKRCGPREKAELHTMLTSTVMIRRYKTDILKTMPKKRRAKASLHVLNQEKWTQFEDLLVELRESKGQLGKLARKLKGDRVDGDSSSAPHLADQAELFPPDLPDTYAASIKTTQTQTPPLTEETEDKRRANVLSRLYGLTGDAKIPLVVDMLKRWLNDSTKGKLCIFAHHLSVLDALQNLSNLSNAPESKQKFIRIDGSTSPKHRQEQIHAFQTDPSTKIALLGITAAGVAVTLTASSTVWFAELFWTPAIMIQAEDRCHRIGQNARVNCLYFVAKGTLDEVLWMLLEKKFQELGEFVEGKEKQKIVVETQYDTLKELHAIFEQFDESDDDEEDGETDFEKLAQDLQLDTDMVHDIERLGIEEQKMLVDEDGDDAEAEGNASDSKMPAVVAPDVTLGTTEEEAICLDDSDDEEACNNASERQKLSPQVSDDHEDSKPAASMTAHDQDTSVNRSRPTALTACRMYSIMIEGASLGVTVGLYNNRIVVSGILPTRVDQNGQLLPKPAVGDILASFNGQIVPLLPANAQFQGICISLRQALARPPVQFIFAEDVVFAADFIKKMMEKQRADIAKKNSEAADNVIDLLDDD
jgi:SWI/SNF-related matrix-associated actin-dependent regulator 1 of chromatin subfamily A